MALYKSTGTKNSSGQDVQEPTGFPAARGSKAVCPAALAGGGVAKTPDHIIVNVGGTFAFAYASASNPDLATDSQPGRLNYTTGSVVSASAGPVRLDINPVAWRRCDGAADGRTGDVTFVYGGPNNQNKNY
tara:strand:- start:707 stop:1099 length:393 start_codon:yes stop_codon:yes gene_type:complete